MRYPPITLESLNNILPVLPTDKVIEEHLQIRNNHEVSYYTEQPVETIRHQARHYVLAKETTPIDTPHVSGNVVATDEVETLPVFLHPFITHTQTRLSDEELMID